VGEYEFWLVWLGFAVRLAIEVNVLGPDFVCDGIVEGLFVFIYETVFTVEYVD